MNAASPIYRPACWKRLQRHDWPGNVRELRNVLERAVILAGEGTLEMKYMPAFLQNRPFRRRDGAPKRRPADDRDMVRFPIGATVGEAEKETDPAHARTYQQQQNARRGDSGHQPQDAAQQAARVQREGERRVGRVGRRQDSVLSCDRSLALAAPIGAVTGVPARAVPRCASSQSRKRGGGASGLSRTPPTKQSHLRVPTE